MLDDINNVVLHIRFKELLADMKHRRDKPVANHFTQTDHTIHNIRVKELGLLFTHSVNDRKDMESGLTDIPGSRKPGGTNETITICGRHLAVVYLGLAWLKICCLMCRPLPPSFRCLHCIPLQNCNSACMRVCVCVSVY